MVGKLNWVMFTYCSNWLLDTQGLYCIVAMVKTTSHGKHVLKKGRRKGPLPPPPDQNFDRPRLTFCLIFREKKRKNMARPGFKPTTSRSKVDRANKYSIALVFCYKIGKSINLTYFVMRQKVSLGLSIFSWAYCQSKVRIYWL